MAGLFGADGFGQLAAVALVGELLLQLDDPGAVWLCSERVGGDGFGGRFVRERLT